jgi:hypothetical protein
MNVTRAMPTTHWRDSASISRRDMPAISQAAPTAVRFSDAIRLGIARPPRHSTAARIPLSDPLGLGYELVPWRRIVDRDHVGPLALMRFVSGRFDAVVMAAQAHQVGQEERAGIKL